MKRLMRLRASKHLRDLCAETEFNRAQLIQPLFVVEGLESEEPIPGLRDNVRHGGSSLLAQIERDLAAGVTQFLLFPVPGQKKEKGFAHRFTADTIGAIRRQFGDDLSLWIDTCLCSYTTHGHCAVLKGSRIDHQATLDELANAALAFAEAGFRNCLRVARGFDLPPDPRRHRNVDGWKAFSLPWSQSSRIATI